MKKIILFFILLFSSFYSFSASATLSSRYTVNNGSLIYDGHSVVGPTMSGSVIYYASTIAGYYAANVTPIVSISPTSPPPPFHIGIVMYTDNIMDVIYGEICESYSETLIGIVSHRYCNGSYINISHYQNMNINTYTDNFSCSTGETLTNTNNVLSCVTDNGGGSIFNFDLSGLIAIISDLLDSFSGFFTNILDGIAESTTDLINGIGGKIQSLQNLFNDFFINFLDVFNTFFSTFLDVFNTFFGTFLQMCNDLLSAINNFFEFSVTYTEMSFDFGSLKNIFTFNFGNSSYSLNTSDCSNIVKTQYSGGYYHCGGDNSPGYCLITFPQYLVPEDPSILALYIKRKPLVQFSSTDNFIHYGPGIDPGYYRNNYDYIDATRWAKYSNVFNYLTINHSNIIEVNTHIFDNIQASPLSITIAGTNITETANNIIRGILTGGLTIIALPIEMINIVINMYNYSYIPFIAGQSYCFAGQSLLIPTNLMNGTRITNGVNNAGSILYMIILILIIFKSAKKVFSNF